MTIRYSWGPGALHFAIFISRNSGIKFGVTFYVLKEWIISLMTNVCANLPTLEVFFLSCGSNERNVLNHIKVTFSTQKIPPRWISNGRPLGKVVPSWVPHSPPFYHYSSFSVPLHSAKCIKQIFQMVANWPFFICSEQWWYFLIVD